MWMYETIIRNNIKKLRYNTIITFFHDTKSITGIWYLFNHSKELKFYHGTMLFK